MAEGGHQGISPFGSVDVQHAEAPVQRGVRTPGEVVRHEYAPSL
jgi:hypothetical protein